jgi:hypothetical protein
MRRPAVRNTLVAVAAGSIALSAFAAAQLAAPAAPAASKSASTPAPRAVPASAPAVPVERLSAPCRAVPAPGEAAFREAFLEGRCANLRRGELTFTAGSFAGPNGPMPLLILSGPERTFSGRIIVTLIGGPGGNVLEFPPDRNSPGNLFPLFEGLVLGGDVVIIPAYAATRASARPRSPGCRAGRNCA